MKSKYNCTIFPRLLPSSVAAICLLAVAAAHAGPQTYPQLILADHPAAYYRLEETGDATTVTDASTNGFNGVIDFSQVDAKNFSPVLGQPGIATNSFLFKTAEEGDGDVSVPLGTVIPGSTNTWNQIINPTTNGNGYFGAPFSGECWVQPISHPKAETYRVPVADFGTYAGGDYTNASGWNFYQAGTASGSYWLLHMKPVVFAQVEKLPIVLGQWYHLVGTFDGKKAVFYINGVAESTDPAKGYVANNGTADLLIGAGPATGQRGFDGRVDEVALYTYPLSAAQVAAHYKLGLSLLPPAKDSPK